MAVGFFFKVREESRQGCERGKELQHQPAVIGKTTKVDDLFNQNQTE